jgi:hypothetical protein
MKKIIFISSIILFACFAPVANGQNQNVLANAMRITGDRFTVSIKTPKGANVYAVTRPSATVVNAIDKGLTDLFAVARKNRYSKKLNYGDYSIFIGKPDRTKNSQGEYSPDIAVPLNQYAGSVYDQGGFMYVAGMVISNEPCAFLIGDHTKDFDRVSNVVRYEGEHLVLYHNDRRRYAATADHSKGGGHPILQ